MCSRLGVNGDVPPVGLHAVRRVVVRLLVHAELEVVLLPTLAGGTQPPLAVDEHGDVPRGDVVDDVKPDPPVVDTVHHHLGQLVVVGELAVVDVQHQRRGVRRRAEYLHHRRARRARGHVHVALELPHSRAVDILQN